MKPVLALLVLATPAAAQIPELHWARSPGSGQWYGFTPTRTTWFDGEALGVANGGHLATIRDSAEHLWFRTILFELDADTTWIGLNDVAVEGSFQWTSGLPVTFTGWQPGQPGAFTPEHDAAVADGGWFTAPPNFAGNQPAIEAPRLPQEGWKLPDGYDLPLLSPGYPEIGDVDGDGLTDVVVPSRHTSGPTFAVLRGVAGGGFAPGQTFGNETQIPRIALADFDGDGRDDVACAAWFTPNLRVYFAGAAVDFAQTWSTPIPASAGDYGGDIAAGDLDGDGRPDLLVSVGTSQVSYRVLVFENDGVGGFHAPLEIPLPNLPQQLVIGDVDGDADLDWISSIAGSGAVVCLNDGTGAPSSVTSLAASFTGTAMALADYDGDARVDLAIAGYAGYGARLMWGDGAGGFDVQAAQVIAAYSVAGLATADFDGDARPDLCATTSDEGVRVVRGRGAGAFSLTTSLFSGSYPLGSCTADLDGDGRPEILWVANVGPGIGWRVLTVRRFATDCDADGVDDTTEIAVDPALDADSDGELDACSSAGTTFCAGDGTATPCPCGNASAPGAGEGCLHSLGTGGRLVALGTPSLAADDVRLLGSRMTNSSALYFQGTLEVAGGAGAVFGDGLRCAGGSVVRLVTRANVGGASRYPETGEPPLATRGGVAAPGARRYQVWFRNAAAFCTASTFNLTGGVRIDWVP